MITLVTMLKRRPGTTHQQFLDHWIGTHGPLIANGAIAPLVQRYEQYPATWPTDDGAREPDWDGVTVQKYASVDDFWAQVSLPDFADMQADILKFLDTDNMPWVLLDEANVVIGSS
jgi:hypothetical protein